MLWEECDHLSCYASSSQDLYIIIITLATIHIFLNIKDIVEILGFRVQKGKCPNNLARIVGHWWKPSLKLCYAWWQNLTEIQKDNTMQALFIILMVQGFFSILLQQLWSIYSLITFLFFGQSFANHTKTVKEIWPWCIKAICLGNLASLLVWTIVHFYCGV